MSWKFDDSNPLYLQIAGQIRTAIISGKYRPGEKLPGVREIAFEANVNPNTMQRALLQLENEGLIVTRGTSGKFISGDEEKLSRAKKLELEELAKDFLSKVTALGLTPSEAAQLIMKGDN